MLVSMFMYANQGISLLQRTTIVRGKATNDNTGAPDGPSAAGHQEFVGRYCSLGGVGVHVSIRRAHGLVLGSAGLENHRRHLGLAPALQPAFRLYEPCTPRVSEHRAAEHEVGPLLLTHRRMGACSFDEGAKATRVGSEVMDSVGDEPPAVL